MTAAVVLCAGGSTRFGDQPKLLAPFRGRPLAAWALDAAGAASFDEVIVVIGSADLSAVLGSQIIVENTRWTSGLASSLRTGVAAAEQRGHEVIVVGLGDQPLVPASAWRAVGGATSPIAVATFGGHRSPPTRLARVVWPLLPTSGDVGARELIQARPDLVCEVACEGDRLDIDTVQELDKWG